MATAWILFKFTFLVLALLNLLTTSEASADLYQASTDEKQEQTEYCSKDDDACDTVLQVDETEMTTLLLVGKTGVGKSATANSIVRLKTFKSQASAEPVTRKFQIEYSHVLGRKVKVVDSPGLADPKLNETENIELVTTQMMKALSLNPDGYDAIIVVFRFGRMSVEDKTTVEYLKAIFGERLVEEFGIMLHTFGDNYDQEENDGLNFDEWCLRQTGLFKDLFREFGERALLFDNKSKDGRVQEEQLKRLFAIVDKMKHGSRRYKPRMFALAQEERDRLLLKSKEPMIRQQTETNTRLLMHELEDINLDNPESDLKKLKILDRKINAILDDVKKQDNGTGVLNNIMLWVMTVKDVVQRKLILADNEIKNAIRDRELKEQIEELKKARENAERMYRNLERPQGNMLYRMLRRLKEFIFGSTDSEEDKD